MYISQNYHEKLNKTIEVCGAQETRSCSMPLSVIFSWPPEEVEAQLLCKNTCFTHCWSSVPGLSTVSSGSSGGRQRRAFLLGMVDFFTEPCAGSWPHVSPALVQLKGNLIRKRNSMRTNIQFGNLCESRCIFFFNTLEDFALILLLGLLIN